MGTTCGHLVFQVENTDLSQTKRGQGLRQMNEVKVVARDNGGGRKGKDSSPSERSLRILLWPRC